MPQRMVEGTAKRLGLDTGYVIPAYEDPCIGCTRKPPCRSTSIPATPSWPIPKSARAWRGCSTRGSTSPMDSCCRSSTRREPGAGSKAGCSERWKLRRGHLFLIPGDSPLGLRLPMSSLLHVPPEEFPYVVEQDPMEPRPDLAADDKDAEGEGSQRSRSRSQRNVERSSSRSAQRYRLKSVTAYYASSCRPWRRSRIISN